MRIRNVVVSGERRGLELFASGLMRALRMAVPRIEEVYEQLLR